MEVVLIIVIVLLITLIVFSVKAYNNLVTLKHSVSKAWVNLEVLLKQRHDELHKLIELCKEFGINELELFEKLRTARAQVMNAQQMGEVRSLGAAECNLRAELNKLLATANENDELSEDKNFLRLQSVFSEFERAITDRCELYNHCIATSNERIEQFPVSVIANFFSFGSYEPLELRPDFDQNISPES